MAWGCLMPWWMALLRNCYGQNNNYCMKNRSTIYFEKRYCLLVHSLTLTQRVSLSSFSTHSGEKETLERSCCYSLNQIVFIDCIDVIKEGVKINDSEASLHFTSLGEKQSRRSEIGVARFDMSQEKVVKPQSTALFAKELREARGVLNYKFINLKTRSITPEEFELHRQRRAELRLEEAHDQQSQKVEELMRLLEQKDELIRSLERRADSLIAEGWRRREDGEGRREGSQEKPLSLHIKVSSANERLKKENEALQMAVAELEERVEELGRQAEDFAREKETHEREVRMLKNQNEKLEKLADSRVRVRARASSIGNPFLKNSGVLNHSNSDLQDPQKPTTITVNEPRPSKITMRESDVLHKATNSPDTSQNRQQMFTSSYLPQASETRREANEEQSPPPPSEAGRSQEQALERRISLQKEDLKWNAIVIQRNEEIQILRRKLESRASDVKTLERELEKAKVQLRKKETEVKEMRRQSRKSLLFGDPTSPSAKDAPRNRSQLEVEFERLQAQHDDEKAVLQEEVEGLGRDKVEREKELKILKGQLTERAERERTAEAKYAQLRKFTQKKEEEFIEYREKSLQYDSISLRNKEVEAAMKALEARGQLAEKQREKVSEVNSGLQGKLKEAVRECDRLKRMEREWEIARNQNINFARSIESYEHRYNQLKKYCIKIEAAYNKFINGKKKHPEEGREEKEMEEKFVELGKRMNDCELTYYKQQIEDYNEEKTFVALYFQRKLKEDKERILDNAELTPEARKTALADKERENEKLMADRLEDIRMKISRLERNYEDANDRISMRESGSGLYKSIPDQLRIMEKKLSAFQERESERQQEHRNLKDTIAQLNNELKKAKSSSHFEGSNAGVMAGVAANSKNQLLLSMIQENRQKNSLLEEARQRSEASQQRTYEENRRMNTQLVKENGELKMKNQKLAMDIDKIERKAQEREKQLDMTFKKSEAEFKLKHDRLLEQLEKATAELDLLRQKLADSQAAVRTISEEAARLSYEVEEKEGEMQRLEEKIANYEDRMEEYEKSERLMLEEVGQIKRDSQQNQQELFTLIETRSNNFTRIEKIKEGEVEKLRAIVRELELKLEAEMFENIKAREKAEELRAAVERVERDAAEKLEQLRVDLASRDAAYDLLYSKDFHTTKENDVLQENLLEISAQIENKEVEVATLTYELTRLNKEVDVYRRESDRFSGLEKGYKEEVEGLQLLLEDKAGQIRGFEEKYRQLQQDLEYSSRDMQRIAVGSLRAEAEAKDYQEKYMGKQEEIIGLKQQCSLLEIEVHKRDAASEDQEKQLAQLRKRIAELEVEVKGLEERGTLNVSRRHSNEADKFDCPSPSRKKLLKRPTALDVPEANIIGAGGITPVSNPIPRNHLENPFEAQEVRKTSLHRKSSESPLESREGEGRGEEIAIHIEEPVAGGPERDVSNIQIDLGEESLRFTSNNSNILRATGKQPSQMIREEPEEAVYHSGGFGHNIELGDSQEDDDPYAHYEERERELRTQLNYYIDENEKLNAEVIQLTQQVDDLAARLQQPSLNASYRKSTLEPPQREGERESREGKADSLPRSSSHLELATSREGARLNSSKAVGAGGSVQELQQQCQAAELEVQYLSSELSATKHELEEQTGNNERLLQEAELCRETIEDLNAKLEEALFEAEQSRQFVQFEELYQRERQGGVELRARLEALAAEIFEREAQVAGLMRENGEVSERLQEARSEASGALDERARLEGRVRELGSMVQRLKGEYRKYEETSELELVRLQEAAEQLRGRLRAKEEEVVVLGEGYLGLEGEKDELVGRLAEREKSLEKQERALREAEARCGQLVGEVGKMDESRQQLFRMIKQLQAEVARREERAKGASSEAALSVRKLEIRLQSLLEEVRAGQERVGEREKTISLLKNEIALYNEECLELKSLNDELAYQSAKVEKELKDIMTTYERELSDYKEVIEGQQREAAVLRGTTREKEAEYLAALKSLRTAEKERDYLQAECLEGKNLLERLRSSKARESHDLSVEVQYKSSEVERLKSSLEQVSKDLESAGEAHLGEVERYQGRLRSYKEKLEKYEAQVEEFEGELRRVGEGPSAAAYEEVVFENELLRNRVEELEEVAGSRSEGREKEEAIYLQFRKYKANKEREIADLEAEMEKYGVKINELEEGSYFLKRENEALRREIEGASEGREELAAECEDLRESLEEVEKELQFYKKRKLLDMQKLLNDTQ